MDGFSLCNEAEKSQCRDLGAASSSSASTGLGWRPSQRVFTPYSPPGKTSEKSQSLRVVVRKPVSSFLILLLILSIDDNFFLFTM